MTKKAYYIDKKLIECGFLRKKYKEEYKMVEIIGTQSSIFHCDNIRETREIYLIKFPSGELKKVEEWELFFTLGL